MFLFTLLHFSRISKLLNVLMLVTVLQKANSFTNLHLVTSQKNEFTVLYVMYPVGVAVFWFHLTKRKPSIINKKVFE